MKEASQILVSIITPSYQAEQTIARTLQSVLEQKHPNLEYIVIDGGSTDGTIGIIESYRQRFQEKGISFTLVSEPDRGIYDAMNKGIAMAHGDIIGIINSDDWYEPQAAQCAAREYCYTGYDMFYADLQIWVAGKDGGLHRKMVKRSRLRHPVVSRDWNHPTTFVTAETYQKYPYRCEGIHDDWELVLRIRKAGLKVVVCNEVLANFRMGGVSNAKSLKKCRERIRDRYHAYRINGYSRLYLVECILIETVKYLAQ